MITGKRVAARCVIGGLAGVGAVLVLILLLNLVPCIGGSGQGASAVRFTTEQAAARFGSAALAVLVEMLSVFVCGACVGLTTLPFSETWTALPGVSALHFVLTGALTQLLGWSYQWLGLKRGWLIGLIGYVAVYLLIWLFRWLHWNAEVRQLRKALGLNQKEDTK